MQTILGFRFYFVAAIGVHFLFALLFSFTFSLPDVPSKTGFVFLGSFLSSQDVGLFVNHPFVVNSGINIKKIKLDSQNMSDFLEVNKPSLIDKISPQQKNQFKPLTVQAIESSKPSKPAASELDAEFGALPPVKLRMGQ